MILAVILEHLKQFSNCFGLSQTNIATSQLQTLVPLLPLPIATSIMLIYFQSDPQRKIQAEIQSTLEDYQISAVLAAGFIAFYQYIDQYSNIKRTFD